jgi:hypothetical protein
MYLESLTKGVKKNDLQTLHTNFKLDHKEEAPYPLDEGG